MKTILCLAFSILALTSFAQTNDGPTEVTPAVKQKIEVTITKGAEQLKQQLKAKYASDLAVEFAVDTFRVNHYMEQYMKYDYTTLGMSTACYEGAQKYDALLNKYYKKLLAKLEGDDKQVLINAQKAWITFRDSEAKLTQTMAKEEYSGGGSIQGNINASDNLEMVKTRTISIYWHLTRGMEEY